MASQEGAQPCAHHDKAPTVIGEMEARCALVLVAAEAGACHGKARRWRLQLLALKVDLIRSELGQASRLCQTLTAASGLAELASSVKASLYDGLAIGTRD